MDKAGPLQKLIRTVSQAVFDSPAAKKVINAGHKQACDELVRTPKEKLDVGNPNHPSYDNQSLGYPERAQLAKQFKSGPTGGHQFVAGMTGFGKGINRE